jgi:hypothetical protein
MAAAGEESNSPSVQSKGFAGRLLVVRKLAEALAGPASSLEASANEYFVDVQAMDAMVHYMLTRIASGEEEVTDDVHGFFESLRGMIGAAAENAVSLAQLRETTRGLPKLSKSLINVSKVIDRALGRFAEGNVIMQKWEPLLDQAEGKAAA